MSTWLPPYRPQSVVFKCQAADEWLDGRSKNFNVSYRQVSFRPSMLMSRTLTDIWWPGDVVTNHVQLILPAYPNGYPGDVTIRLDDGERSSRCKQVELSMATSVDVVGGRLDTASHQRLNRPSKKSCGLKTSVMMLPLEWIGSGITWPQNLPSWGDDESWPS